MPGVTRNGKYLSYRIARWGSASAPHCCDCGGGKGDGKRGRAADKDLAAAADEAADEQLALALQEAENKKTNNSSGGYDDAQIARDEQKKEDEKTKKPKVMPSLVKVKNSKPSDSAVRLYLFLTNIF